MEIKTYKRLFAFVALLSLGVAASAQDTLPAPPLPPENYKLNKEYKPVEGFDAKTMKQFNFKMKGLNKKMFALSNKINAKVFVKMKGFDKKFQAEFKDFGKNFAGSFSGMVPDIDVDINNNVSRSLSDAEYKKQLASGEIIEKVKNFTKSYSVNSDDVLQIYNKFGKVTVNTWNKNEFKVDVQMKFSSDNERAVNDLIEGSGVTDSRSGNVVTFRTTIGNSNNNGGNRHQNMSIDYTVYMPSRNALEISNQFGGIVLPDLSGKVNVKLQFGRLVAQQLTNSQNDINISFEQGGPSTIEVLNGGKIKVQHGKVKLGTINNMTGDFDFSNVDIDRLKGTSDIDVKYNRLNIGALDKAAKDINIKSQFTKINFDIKENDNFLFDVTAKMAGFDNGSGKAKITGKTPGDDERGYSSTKTYKGYVGKSNSDNKITIVANFGDINFN